MKATYEDFELENIVDDIGDISDISQVTYEVWALGYDKDDQITEAELLIKTFSDSDEAVEFAKGISLADIVNHPMEEDFIAETDYEVSYIVIEVETVITNEDAEAVNVGTIYRNTINFEVEDPVDIHVTVDTYKLRSDGSLMIPCELINPVKDDEYLKIMFDDEDEHPVLTFKITSKVNNNYICEFIC